MSETYTWMVDVEQLYTLTINMAGPSGAGYVDVYVGGSVQNTCSFPGPCNFTYMNGTVVTLHANAYSGYQFSGYSGGCSGTSDCTLTMNGNKTVTATFATLSGSIGTLDEAGSTWYHGPYYPGQTSVTIAVAHVGNIGYTNDTVSRKYMYKDGSGNYQAIQTFTGYIPVNGWQTYTDVITIPAGIQTCSNTQCVKFCIKVWGTGESEPANPTLEWDMPMGSLALSATLGIVAVAGLIGVAWYTKKKKMW